MNDHRGDHQPAGIPGAAQNATTDQNQRIGDHIGRHADHHRRADQHNRRKVLTRRCEHAQQRFAKHHKNNRQHPRIADTEQKSRADHLIRARHFTRSHGAAGHAHQGDIQPHKRHKGQHVPVEHDGHGGPFSDAVGLKQEQKNIEGAQADKHLQTRGEAEAQIAAHNARGVNQRFMHAKALGVNPVEVKGQVYGDGERRRDNRADARADDSQGGKTQLAKNQHIAQRHIEQHADHVGDHHHASAPYSGKIRGKNRFDQKQQTAADEHQKKRPLQGDLLRGVSHPFKRVLRRPGQQPEQRLGKHREDYALSHHLRAAMHIPTAVVLRDDGISVGHNAVKKA